MLPVLVEDRDPLMQGYNVAVLLDLHLRPRVKLFNNLGLVFYVLDEFRVIVRVSGDSPL